MVQRWKPSWVQGRMIPAGVHPIDGYVSAADHARIVAEAGAAVFAFHPEWTVTGMCDSDCLACRRLTELITEREKGYEEGKADAEQAHAAALAEAVRESAAHHYRMGKARGADLALNHDGGDEVMSDIPAPKMSANDAIGDILRFNIDSDAAAPRTLTADDDCMHLAEVYVGEGKRGSVIECLMCGGLRSDDSTVPPERVPRTLTADDPGYHSQRCLHCDHIRATHTLTAHGCIGHALPGRPGADCPCAEFIHDGEATPQVKPCSTCGEPVAYLTARPGWAGGWLHHPSRPLDGHPAAIDGEATP